MLGEFIVAAAASDDQGFGGCEIWINSLIPVATRGDQRLRVVNQNVSILVADPRRLLICVRASAFTVYGVSLHAPDASHQGGEELQIQINTTQH